MFTRKFPVGSFLLDDEDFFHFPTYSFGFNLFEEGDNIVVEAALPGLKAKQIQVTHAHGYLLIEGEKKEEKKERRYYRKGCSTFSYRIPIPAAADVSREPEAVLEDGVMRITFKKGGGGGRSIPVKEGRER